jgi:hypothetical protein
MANYLNRPSIFEIATAFEDGQEGEIKQKDKGPYETYRALSDDEKSFVFKHPTLAYKFNKNAKKAKRIGRELEGTKNGYGDAVRHCYWCALNQMDAGLNSSRAKEFGDAHENIPNNEAKTMDLHNNSVGYHLGNQAIINGWSEEELLNQVINAANNGKLQIGL